MATPTEKHLVNQMTNTAPKRSPPAETMSVGGTSPILLMYLQRALLLSVFIFLNESDISITQQHLLPEVPDTLHS